MARMPKDSVLFDLFTAQGERLAAVGVLIPTIITEKPSKRGKIYEEISTIETDADKLLVQVLNRADSMLITPFDRSDIHSLTTMLDDSIDWIEAAAELTVLHNVETFPKGVEPLADCVRRMAELTAGSISRLRAAKDLDFYYTEADKIEDEGDRLHRRLIAKLYSGEFDALTVLRVQGVVDALEQALNHMERVSRIVHSVASQGL